MVSDGVVFIVIFAFLGDFSYPSKVFGERFVFFLSQITNLESRVIYVFLWEKVFVQLSDELRVVVRGWVCGFDIW